MNERMSPAPRQLSEVEKNILDIQGKLDTVPEINPEEVQDFSDSSEGLVEELIREGEERATLENISAAIKKHAADNDGAKPLDANEFDDSIDVDLSDLDKAA